MLNTPFDCIFRLQQEPKDKIMKKILLLLAITSLMACNPTKKLPSLQSQADAAFEQADYNKAYTLYKEYTAIASTNNVDITPNLNVKLAQACVQLDKVDEASALYNALLEDEAQIKLIAEYAQMLQSKGQVDDELALWNTHKSQLESSDLQKLSFERLITLQTSKKDYAAVIASYNSRGDLKASKQAQLSHVKALEATKKGYAAVKACNLLLKEAPDYTEALEWKAKYYYEKAEKRYQYEMAKYNKKKNATTYAYLRRDLKKVSADFRIARSTYLKLRKQDASNKSYIRHLKNIYLRLDQKGEAAKMDRLLK